MNWHDRAACRGKDGDAFFPEKGGSPRAAKRICGTCPVQVECLDYALANGERFGVWGGKTERERRRMAGYQARSEATHFNASKTHCKRDHPLSGDNLRVDPKTGFRICKACGLDAQRRFLAGRSGPLR